MREQDAVELRRLIPELVRLLGAVASGEREPIEAADEYVHLHREVRRILTVKEPHATLRLMSVIGMASALACLAVPAVRELTGPEQRSRSGDALDLARADE